jgi:hypothetical protein
MWLLGMVIRVAPIGIFCLVFTLVARMGFEVIRLLGAPAAVVVARGETGGAGRSGADTMDRAPRAREQVVR